MINNIYYKPKKNGVSEVKIERSKFISLIFIVNQINDIENYLKSVKDKYRQATHYCYAYKYGITNVNEYNSDGGEPSGSAGKPILGAINKYSLTNSLLIVIRYYGGIKLGIRGLIDAYHKSACQVIENTGYIKIIPVNIITFTTSYNNYNNVINMIEKNVGKDISINSNYGIEIRLSISIPHNSITKVENLLKSLSERSIINNLCIK